MLKPGTGTAFGLSKSEKMNNLFYVLQISSPQGQYIHIIFCLIYFINLQAINCLLSS